MTDQKQRNDGVQRSMTLTGRFPSKPNIQTIEPRTETFNFLRQAAVAEVELQRMLGADLDKWRAQGATVKLSTIGTIIVSFPDGMTIEIMR